MRREIAFLIEKGKFETARIKTENIINEVFLLSDLCPVTFSNPLQDIYAELLELLELYCEVLNARFGLLDLPYVFFSGISLR
jgi:vacuolar protein sorting-associated protein IST1